MRAVNVRLYSWKSSENVIKFMATGRRMKKMVLKVFLKKLLITFGSGTTNDKHGRSVDSGVVPCGKDRGSQQEKGVELEEDHVFDQ